MGATESWVYLDAEGRLIMRVENDGPRVLRRGPEAADTVVTPEDLRHYPGLYKEAEELLKNRGASK